MVRSHPATGEELWVKHQRLQSSGSDLLLQHRDLASKMLFFPVAFKIVKSGEPGALVDVVALDKIAESSSRMGTYDGRSRYRG